MVTTQERFIIQGFHGALPERVKESFNSAFRSSERNTWTFDGDWNALVAILGQKFLAYHRPEIGEWHIYVTAYPHFTSR
jgi:hypothetical protein